MPRRKKNKYEYEYYREPICECMRCGNVHLRRERKKIITDGDDKFLSIRVCPKCGKEPYLYAGDKEIRRRVKIDDV